MIFRKFFTFKLYRFAHPPPFPRFSFFEVFSIFDYYVIFLYFPSLLTMCFIVFNKFSTFFTVYPYLSPSFPRGGPQRTRAAPGRAALPPSRERATGEAPPRQQLRRKPPSIFRISKFVKVWLVFSLSSLCSICSLIFQYYFIFSNLLLVYCPLCEISHMFYGVPSSVPIIST